MDGLSYEVESVDDLPEAVRDFYKAGDDGKYRLAVDGLPKPEDTSGLKSALKKERDRARQAERWERLGKTPEEIEELLESQRKAEEERQRKAGDFEAIRKQDAEKFQKQVAEAQTAREKAEARMRDAVIGSELMTALARAKATETGLKALPRLLRDRVEFELNDEGYSVRILNERGEPLAGSDGAATFDDLAKAAMAEFPDLFASDRPGGAGTSGRGGSGAGGKTMRREDFDQIADAAEKAKLISSGYKII